jgi:hypothetical protein
MSCQIKNGKYYAPNGKPSTLHKQLLGKVSQEQADDLFVLAYSERHMSFLLFGILDTFIALHSL